MKYKLAAIDIDDTLITDELTITPKVKRAIDEARAAGLIVVLATGRGFEGMLGYYEELALDTPVICYAGAEIRDKNKNIISSTHIDGIPALRLAKSFGVHAQVYADGCFHYERPSQYAQMYEQNYGMRGILEPELTKNETYPTPKVIITDTVERTDELLPHFKSAFPDKLVHKSKPYFIEVHHPHATKGDALRTLSKMLEISREEIIAIGDSPIDSPMIEWAGLGLAMENSFPEVIALADAVLPSNQDDGVAYAMEKYILGRG